MYTLHISRLPSQTDILQLRYVAALRFIEGAYQKERKIMKILLTNDNEA